MHKLAAHPNAVLFLTGFVVFVGGVSAWSVPAAAIVAGVILMAVAVYPFLGRKAE